MRKIFINSIKFPFKYLLYAFELVTGQFLTYALRPSFSKKFVKTLPNTNYPKMGIVIQGPIISKRYFTLETIKTYKKIFPEALIILSTWEDEDPSILKKISSENIEIVLNKKPAFSGQQNINYQIVSSFSGTARAKELNCKYILKTRTDQRIYSPNTLKMFYNLTKAFPIKNEVQKKRIVGVSLNTYKYRLYGLSDMNIFAHIDDAFLYWSCPLDERINPTEMKDLQENKRVCEVYLTTEFMKKIKRATKWTLEDSWDFFSKNLCVIDQQSIELYWRKYDNYKEYRRSQYYSEKNDKQLSFSEWLEMFINQNNINLTKELIEKKF